MENKPDFAGSINIVKTPSEITYDWISDDLYNKKNVKMMESEIIAYAQSQCRETALYMLRGKHRLKDIDMWIRDNVS